MQVGRGRPPADYEHEGERDRASHIVRLVTSLGPAAFRPETFRPITVAQRRQRPCGRRGGVGPRRGEVVAPAWRCDLGVGGTRL